MPSVTVEIETRDGTANAYLATPEGSATPGGPASAPAVLLLMDAFGLRPRIEQMADRIAAEGYTVLAPNVFYRAGRDPVPEMPDMSDQTKRAEAFGKLRPLMEALTPDAVMSDGGAYLGYLESAAPGPAAISGYCMGGRLGFQIAADHPARVAALGAFHAGRLVTDGPDSPHLRAPEVKAEVVFGYADNDQSAAPGANRSPAAPIRSSSAQPRRACGLRLRGATDRRRSRSRHTRQGDRAKARAERRGGAR